MTTTEILKRLYELQTGKVEGYTWKEVKVRAKKAVELSKTTPVRKFSLKEGKKLAYKLIDKWAKEK